MYIIHIYILLVFSSQEFQRVNKKGMDINILSRFSLALLFMTHDNFDDCVHVCQRVAQETVYMYTIRVYIWSVH